MPVPNLPSLNHCRTVKNYFYSALPRVTWCLVAGLLPLLAASGALAQNPGITTGRVQTEAGAPIDYATVTLHRAADSTLLKTEFSDARGEYRFEQVAAGKYRVSAAQVGYNRAWSTVFELPGSSAGPTLTLRVNAATQLKEVQVVGQKPLYERLADRTVVNVEGSTLATGNSTLEVLSRAPGVTVDANDNLALRGRQGLLVMIDGKRQPMTGAELADYLRALPADQLKSIELITSPPAKYDAQGSAGIIDIKLKKDQRQGTNGSGNVSYGRGQFGRFTTSAAGNHRQPGLNLFASTTYTRRSNLGIRNTYRRFYETRDGQPELVGVADQRNTQTGSDHFLIWRAGADVDLSKNTRLGGVVTGFAVPNPRPGGSSSNTSYFYDGGGQLTDYYTAQGTGLGYNPNITANLNFKHVFAAAKVGKPELTADLDYARYYTHRLQSLTTFNEQAGRPPTLLNGDQTGELVIQAAKVDYTQALREKTTLEAGAKASRVFSDNDILFLNTQEGITTVDEGRTNRFRYDELISAAYVNLSHTAGKLNLQAGLRGEQTHATGEQVVAADNFRRDYYQLFPTASVKYTPSAVHEWTAALSRRINRPSYRQLNPFRFVVDPTTTGKGNPELRPETSYNLEVAHTFQQKFTATLSYSLTQDPITDVAQPESRTSTVSMYVNLNRQHYGALTLTAPLTPAKWWNVYNNAVFFYIHYQGTLANTALNRGQGAFTLSSNSTFTFGKGWGAELSGNYYSRQRVGFFLFQDYGQLNLGVQKALWDRKATLKLAATDVLLTTPLRARSNYNNYQEDLYLRRDSRVVTLSLGWRLGNDKLTSTTRRSGAEDEKRRAQ
ncbi:outer membrane receptor protein involved in Fe transport [Hymenobacter chitinivorans DSM 11115]|uniref:Outer membrane receptor protein involved in Fe transport n=1 Tax=Hymenobacter chitinivorans DSM 11115 TaxID=1121954 RepID=A0A2M9BQ24_9BACT|nr:outer membrane receptor protein involved in Fe transport [Hymenobacter chitinivorans DSM 11115]